jgi:hypothetical protein
MGKFVVIHDKHCVCTFLSHFLIPLCHPPKLLAKCSLPHFGCGCVIHQFLVTGDCFTHDGMHHGTGKVFKHCRDALLCVLHEAQQGEFIAGLSFFLDGEHIYCLSGYYSLPCFAQDRHNVVGEGVA